MKTFPNVSLQVFKQARERAEIKKINDQLRQVSGGLARSLSSGQSPKADIINDDTDMTDIRHDQLLELDDDDHTQYLLLDGRDGQTVSDYLRIQPIAGTTSTSLIIGRPQTSTPNLLEFKTYDDATTLLKIDDDGALVAGTSGNVQVEANGFNIKAVGGSTNVYQMAVGLVTGTFTGNGLSINLKSTSSGNSPQLTIDNRTNGSAAGILQKIIRKGSPSSQTGDLLQFLDSDGSTKLSFVDKDGVFNGPVASYGSGTTTFTDSLFRLQDNSDNTKYAAFECSGLPTSATTTFTFPGASTTLAGLAIQNNFTRRLQIKPSTAENALQLDATDGIGSARLIEALRSTDGAACLVLTAGGALISNAFSLYNGEIGLGAQASFNTSLLSADRDFALPDAGGTFVVRSGTPATGRIPFYNSSGSPGGSNGVLTSDADITFSTDTLTVTKIAATQFTGDITIADTKNIVLNSTTGTKIGTGTTQKLGFFNKTPIAQPAALTASLTSITHTAPGTEDFAIQDLTAGGFGFVTKDEGNTVLKVILNLQTRVNELETKLASTSGLGLIA